MPAITNTLHMHYEDNMSFFFKDTCRLHVSGFYRAMYFSAKRGLAIPCRLSVCLSVCPFVCLSVTLVLYSCAHMAASGRQGVNSEPRAATRHIVISHTLTCRPTHSTEQPPSPVASLSIHRNPTGVSKWCNIVWQLQPLDLPHAFHSPLLLSFPSSLGDCEWMHIISTDSIRYCRVRYEITGRCTKTGLNG